MASPAAPQKLRPRYKIGAYSAAWILALYATDPTLGYWSLAWMFPLGLFAFVAPEHRQAGGWTVMAAVWAIYLVHGFFYFRSRTKRSTFILLATLVLLLLCNISGCRSMIHAH